MLCSSLISMYSLDNYKKTQTDTPEKMESAKTLCFLAFLMLLVEIALLVYAIMVAVNWEVESTLQRFVHVFLAVFLTIPYILVTIIAKSLPPSPSSRSPRSYSKFACGM